MAAYDDPQARSGGWPFRLFLAVYIAAVLGVVYIVVHGLWTEVLAAWPR